MAAWLLEWWPVISFGAIQFVGSILAFQRLQRDVAQLRVDLDHLREDAEPVMRASGEMSGMFRDLLRRFDELEERAARDRAEVMLAINAGTSRVEGRVGELEKRTFELVSMVKGN